MNYKVNIKMINDELYSYDITETEYHILNRQLLNSKYLVIEKDGSERLFNIDNLDNIQFLKPQKK